MAAGHVTSREADFSPQCADVGDLFLGHLVGDDENDAITFRARDESEAEASVAGGRFDDGSTRLQFALLFCRFDHGQRNAVLDRAGGILIFQLHKKLARPGVDARDLDQWCMADEGKDGGRFVR